MHPQNSEASTELGKYVGLNAIDGNRNTHWFSKKTEAEPFLIIDKGREGCITEVATTFFPLDLPLTLHIESSSDKHTWKKETEARVTTPLHTSTLPFPSTARYFKMKVSESARGYGSISEVVLLQGAEQQQ